MSVLHFLKFFMIVHIFNNLEAKLKIYINKRELSYGHKMYALNLLVKTHFSIVRACCNFFQKLLTFSVLL